MLTTDSISRTSPAADSGNPRGKAGTSAKNVVHQAGNCDEGFSKALRSGFGGLEVACWPLVTKFAGSNPAETVGFFRDKKSSARLPSEGK